VAEGIPGIPLMADNVALAQVFGGDDCVTHCFKIRNWENRKLKSALLANVEIERVES
jgi:hypothetical protein